MARLYGNSSASTAPHQRQYRAKKAHLLRRKLTSAEVMRSEIELQSSPAKASESADGVSVFQARAALSIVLFSLGTMSLLLQAPVASRQPLALTTQSGPSAAASMGTFLPQEQGSDTLAKARQIAKEQGNLDVAIATATQVPSHSLLYSEVQTQILQWQQQKWQAQDAAFQRMKQAYTAKNWQTVLDIAAKDIPQTQYWLNHQGVLQMMVKAKTELLTAAKISSLRSK